jgi:hypothetical protein
MDGHERKGIKAGIDALGDDRQRHVGCRDEGERRRDT